MDSTFVSLNDKFKLLNEVKKLFIYSDCYVYENFPKNKKHLKVIYFEEIKSLFNNMVNANNHNAAIRRKYQDASLTNLSLLDFLISYFYDLKIVNKKRYSSVCRLLNNIKILLSGWINEKK